MTAIRPTQPTKAKAVRELKKLATPARGRAAGGCDVQVCRVKGCRLSLPCRS